MNRDCQDCGAPLTYAGKGQPPKRCPACAEVYKSHGVDDWEERNRKREQKLAADDQRGLLFRARGFLWLERVPFSDPERYFDFTTKKWTDVQLEADLKAGVLPWGMIVQLENGWAGCVVPDPSGGQMVRPMGRGLEAG